MARQADLLSCCRCCLAARKDDLIKYGRKLLKSETALWRDPEIIAEVLGLAEDTEHRGNILVDIESKFTDKKVGVLSYFLCSPLGAEPSYLLIGFISENQAYASCEQYAPSLHNLSHAAVCQSPDLFSAPL